mgnify:FL=1
MSTSTLSKKIIAFNRELKLDTKLPDGITVMNPFESKTTRKLSEDFYTKFYDDHHPRVMLLGINPGRFGAGVTGIPFTDPIRLEQKCGISNVLNKKPELSSQFVYQMIDAFGGVDDFYSRFLVSAVSPLGFLKDGKNINYYDLKSLQNTVEPFILNTMKQQLNFGVSTKTAICLGEGKNYKYLTKINREYHFFDEIVPLSHPRYIMQYKRKQLNSYIRRYLDVLEKATSAD